MMCNYENNCEKWKIDDLMRTNQAYLGLIEYDLFLLLEGRFVFVFYTKLIK